MKASIENILSELVNNVAKHFNLDFQDALAAVAQSDLANELCLNGNDQNRSIEELCAKLYDEIANAE